MTTPRRLLGPTRVPVRLTGVEFELTTACPCRCTTCGSAAGKARSDELSEAQWLAVAEQAAALGARRLSLLGGEPFSVEYWPRLVARATDLGMHVEVITSGVGVDERTAAVARECGLHSLTVSIDGTAEIHDRQRRVRGCYADAMRTIRLFLRAGVPVGVTSQVNVDSWQSLEALAPELEAAGAYGWQLQLTLPMGRARRERALLPSHMPELHAMLRRLARRPRLRPYITDDIGYWTPDDPWLRTPNGTRPRCWLGCMAGVRHMGITSDGRVKGCLTLPDTHVEGNVRDASLGEIWSSPDAFSYNRRRLELAGACATCQEGELCRGGCLAAALAFHGREGVSKRCLRLHVSVTQQAELTQSTSGV